MGPEAPPPRKCLPCNARASPEREKGLFQEARRLAPPRSDRSEECRRGVLNGATDNGCPSARVPRSVLHTRGSGLICVTRRSSETHQSFALDNDCVMMRLSLQSPHAGRTSHCAGEPLERPARRASWRRHFSLPLARAPPARRERSVSSQQARTVLAAPERERRRYCLGARARIAAMRSSCDDPDHDHAPTAELVEDDSAVGTRGHGLLREALHRGVTR